MEPRTDEHPKLEAVLSRLEGVRRSGNQYDARCPAHDDRDPSLRVRLGQRWVMLHCHVGCDWRAIVTALGLKFSDLALDDGAVELRPRRDTRGMELESLAAVMRLQGEREVLNRLNAERAWAPAALERLGVGWDGARLTLPVRDKDGKLHDVLRYYPFKQTRQALGDWVKIGKPPRKVMAGKGKSRLPWPAPESPDPETDTCILVEGEGTAISLRCIGYFAVGLPGSVAKPSGDVRFPGRWEGAGWHKAWANRFKHFRYVVCFPDCDAHGRALMMAARYDIEKLGIPCRVVDLEPLSQDGRDIADILLSTTIDGASRRAARGIVREIVADRAEVLLAA